MMVLRGGNGPKGFYMMCGRMPGVGKLHHAKDAWNGFAHTLTTCVESLDTSVTALVDIVTPSSQRHVTNLTQLQVRMKNPAKKCQELADASNDYADHVLIARGILIGLGVLVTATLAVTFGVGLTGATEAEIAAIGGSCTCCFGR